MRFHATLSIDEALKSWGRKRWRALAKANGRSVTQMKQLFNNAHFAGKKYFSLGEPCEGFTFENGCPGHEVSR